MEALRRAVREHAGIDGQLWSTDRIRRFVHNRVAALDLEHPERYVALLTSDDPSGEIDRLCELVTVGETWFFRDRHQLAALCRGLLDRVHGAGPLNIWSAGCSTGEEPYTLAMLLARAGIAARIVGTDVNRRNLDSARRGRFASWARRQMPADLIEIYFDGDQLRLDDLPAVEFRQHNLHRDPMLVHADSDGWDAILCRNVLIYLAADARRSIGERLCAALRPDGLLALGSSEVLPDMGPQSQPIEIEGRVLYRRRPTPSAPEHETQRPLPGQIQPPRYATLVELVKAEWFADAEKLAARCAGAIPTDVRCKLARGHMYLRAHDFEGALAAYGEARHDDPLLPEPHIFCGIVHRKAGDLATAATDLERAVFLAPNCWQATFLLATTYERLGRWRGSHREFLHTRQILGDGDPARWQSSDPVFLDWFLPTAAAALDVTTAQLATGRPSNLDQRGLSP